MINFIKVRKVKTPERAHKTDAGIDFFIPDDLPSDYRLAVPPHSCLKIPSGIKLIIPNNYAGIFKNKSSIGSMGLILGPCVVDSGYRGEIQILLWNISNKEVILSPGQKITQMLIQRVENNPMREVTLETFIKNETERGSGGFGSTGK